jgi:hypothetical protein
MNVHRLPSAGDVDEMDEMVELVKALSQLVDEDRALIMMLVRRLSRD